MREGSLGTPRHVEPHQEAQGTYVPVVITLKFPRSMVLPGCLRVFCKRDYLENEGMYVLTPPPKKHVDRQIFSWKHLFPMVLMDGTYYRSSPVAWWEIVLFFDADHRRRRPKPKMGI